jgi:hypothetical protein
MWKGFGCDTTLKAKFAPFHPLLHFRKKKIKEKKYIFSFYLFYICTVQKER